VPAWLPSLPACWWALLRAVCNLFVWVCCQPLPACLPACQSAVVLSSHCPACLQPSRAATQGGLRAARASLQERAASRLSWETLCPWPPRPPRRQSWRAPAAGAHSWLQPGRQHVAGRQHACMPACMHVSHAHMHTCPHTAANPSPADPMATAFYRLHTATAPARPACSAAAAPAAQPDTSGGAHTPNPPTHTPSHNLIPFSTEPLLPPHTFRTLHPRLRAPHPSTRLPHLPALPPLPAPSAPPARLPPQGAAHRPVDGRA
jgi:hypothetical protein